MYIIVVICQRYNSSNMTMRNAKYVAEKINNNIYK